MPDSEWTMLPPIANKSIPKNSPFLVDSSRYENPRLNSLRRPHLPLDTAKPSRTIQVFGPAYLDRVLLVDRPIADHQISKPLDLSAEGVWNEASGEGLTLVDPEGTRIIIDLPHDWPGPTGLITLSRSLGDGVPDRCQRVESLSWHDDLGGMGAGYASALGGSLVSALGPESDPLSQFVSRALADQGIKHQPIRIPETSADTTLLVTSGPHRDKLPVGFRGCHARVATLAGWVRDADMRVVAGLPNRVAAEVLRAPGRTLRFFAPALRNMTDNECPVARFANAIDLLCCNRSEWERLEGREQVAWQVSILVITEGAEGSLARFTTEHGEPGEVRLPAFPRRSPPIDTNRAGEAFGARFAATLLEHGWKPGVASPDLIREAALKASAAAALQLDLERFGFPDETAVNEAIRNGRVGPVEPRCDSENQA